MTEAKGLTRREVLTNLAVTSGACLVPKQLLTFPWLSGLPAANERRPMASAGDAEIVNVQPFPMTAVRLRPGPFQEAMEINRRYLHLLPNDRLLHMFRVTAGLPSTAKPLEGMESATTEFYKEFRGHFAGGHYLSACALTYASTGDAALKAKADELVAELAKCQAADGYLGANSTENYTLWRNGGDMWSPLYVYHKILAGHIDMYRHCGNTQALTTAERMVTWLANYMRPIGDEKWTAMLMKEHGGMLEVLLDLYVITKKQEYLTLARRFNHAFVFDPLAAQQDKLTGLHGNTTIPKIVGAALEYEVTGEARYRAIAEYFWQEVTSKRCYCAGGTTNGESWWLEPEELDLGWGTQECCCAYNLLKLTRHVFSWSGDATLMDYYERVLFNHRLGTQNPDGLLMYYIPLSPGAWKIYGAPFDAFWCCTGTGVEEFAKLGDTIYYHDAQSLYVNLFIASEVHWVNKKVRLVQTTRFPEETGTRLVVQCKSPVTMALKIRVPYWADAGMTLTVNGKQQKVSTTPSSYITLNRRWRDGDIVDVRFPMQLHVAPLLGDSTLQAMMYGPLVLAGRLGAVKGETVVNYASQTQSGGLPMPEIVPPSSTATSWVEPIPGESLSFRTAGQSHSVNLVPLYKINERYTVYWQVSKGPTP